jgi:hypothetical protein
MQIVDFKEFNASFHDAGGTVGRVKNLQLAPQGGSRPDVLGAPVLEGEKWVATKWLRESRYG